MTAYPKPTPRLLKRQARAELAAIDREQRQICRARSGGQCEVRVDSMKILSVDLSRRCARRASQNHHLIGGSGRRNRGRSILAAHRLEVCDKCHQDITNHVLVPVDGTQAEDANTVRYERRR